MRVVHEPAADRRDSASERPGPPGEGRESAVEPRVLATDVEVADSSFARGRGLMFRWSIPDDYALVFPFDGQRRRGLHMAFVPFDIDAVWTADGVVQEVRRLAAWTGRGRAVADTIFELPAGAADGVVPGDRISVTDGDGPGEH